MKIYDEISKPYSQVCAENRQPNGFIGLDELLPNGFSDDSREQIGNEDKTKNWIRLDGIPYLYKGQYCDSIEDSGYAYSELIVYELAKQVGIEAAEYDLAQFDGEYGIITKSVVSGKQDMVSLVSLLGEENDTCEIGELIENFEEMLIQQNASNIDELKDEFVSRRIFDLFIIATDTHTENISMIMDKDDEGKDRIRFSPLYDNESALVMDHTKWQMKYLLDHKDKAVAGSYIDSLEPTISSDDGWHEELNVLFSYPAGYEFIKKCFENLDVSKAISDVEQKIGHKIPTVIKESAQFAFDTRKVQIEACLIPDKVKIKEETADKTIKFRRKLISCYDENGYDKVSREEYDFL